MTTAEELEARTYFADAIASSLGTDLPKGAAITVTSIKNGVASYEIAMNVDSSLDVDVMVASI